MKQENAAERERKKNHVPRHSLSHCFWLTSSSFCSTHGVFPSHLVSFPHSSSSLSLHRFSRSISHTRPSSGCQDYPCFDVLLSPIPGIFSLSRFLLFSPQKEVLGKTKRPIAQVKREAEPSRDLFFFFLVVVAFAPTAAVRAKSQSLTPGPLSRLSISEGSPLLPSSRDACVLELSYLNRARRAVLVSVKPLCTRSSFSPQKKWTNVFSLSLPHDADDVERRGSFFKGVSPDVEWQEREAPQSLDSCTQESFFAPIRSI